MMHLITSEVKFVFQYYQNREIFQKLPSDVGRGGSVERGAGQPQRLPLPDRLALRKAVDQRRTRRLCNRESDCTRIRFKSFQCESSFKSEFELHLEPIR